MRSPSSIEAHAPALATSAATDRGESTATCPVCPHRCRLHPGQLGRCRARRESQGSVVAANYGRVTSLALDPIEKKPLARYMPGTLVLSVGSYGCNLTCPFCQNHEIAQVSEDDIPWREIAPDELVDMAVRLRSQDKRVTGIAYTYNEPLVGWEYVRDCAERAHREGLVNVLVSNGLANERVIHEIAPLIDAANIDLKGFSPAFYERCAGGPDAFDCVRKTIQLLAAEPGCHVEVTTLIVPGMNDTEAEIDATSSWLAALPYQTPAGTVTGAEELTYHVTRFFPRWRLRDRSPTPVDTVYACADVARRHLRHVYTGNC